MTKLILLLLTQINLIFAQNCKNGGIYNSQFNKCYNYFDIPAQFSIAEESCELLGGALSSIANAFENAIVTQNGVIAFANSNYTDFWLGASDLVNPGKWAWQDGSPWSYQNWDNAEPRQGKDCASALLKSGKWVSNECDVYRPYACESPPLAASTCPPPATAQPITCPQIECTQKPSKSYCDSEWSYFEESDSCYKVGYWQKFYDAEAQCVMLGAHLTSMHNDEESTFINNLAKAGLDQKDAGHLTWVGMHQVGNEWVWLDGSKSDYFNWAPKQPDNPGKELCVQTASDYFKDILYEHWNNYDCNVDMRSYVCKKPAYHS